VVPVVILAGPAWAARSGPAEGTPRIVREK
jgi:hypothetical protein